MTKSKTGVPKSRSAINAPAVVVKQSSQLSLANPRDVMEFGSVLKNFIKQNDLSVKIGDSDYAKVDAWKFAGISFGLTGIPSEPKAEHKHGQHTLIMYALEEFLGKNGKYKKEVPVYVGLEEHIDVIARVRERAKERKKEITREVVKPYFAYRGECIVTNLKNGKMVTRGTGFCSNLELLKTGFDEYSVISMTETRSIGKGFRNLLGFVMKAADMGETPAEEMTQEMGHVTPIPTETKVMSASDISQEKFNAIMAQVISGKLSVEKVKEHYDLSKDQIEALEIAEKSRK